MIKKIGRTNSPALFAVTLMMLFSVLSFSALATTVNTEPNDNVSNISVSTLSGVDMRNIELLDLKMVGKADMDLLWFSVYSATLLSVNGQYQTEQFPLKLEIQYHRDIEADDLIEATVEQWEHIGIDDSLIPRLQAQIEDAWPNVKEGDKLSFMMHEQGIGQFFFNDEALPMIVEPGFSEAFLGIWLSENTSRPELRQQLIGATND